MYIACINWSIPKGGKFAERSRLYIYVGNDDEANGYHMYDMNTRETTTHGLVKFVENVDEYCKLLTKYLWPNSQHLCIFRQRRSTYIWSRTTQKLRENDLGTCRMFLSTHSFQAAQCKAPCYFSAEHEKCLKGNKL